MSSDQVTYAVNPFASLLALHKAGHRNMEEALFLTFNIDVGFLEGRLLGLCHSTGARVTAISDARVWNPDPRAASAIGTKYHVSRAFMLGKFHPKVTVVAGPEACFVAIGSGNLTLGGWQYNSELWTIFTATNGQAPAILTPIADWLEQLPSHILLDELSGDAISRTTNSIRRYVDTSTVVDTGHTFVASTHSPILDQIDATDVDELNLYAPFHDPRSSAVEALIQRLNPQRVRILVQPGLTVIDADALRNLVSRHEIPIEIHADPERRYRHGKLIEWSKAGERWALTGSPNLSNAALGETIGTGGNCEVGLITAVPATLMPRGIGLSALELQTVRIRPLTADAAHTAGPQILSATIVGSGVDVVLVAPASVDVGVHLSHRSAGPGDWQEIGTLPAHDDSGFFDFAADSGSRLRLQYRDDGGAIHHSQLVFLSDPVAVLRQPINGAIRAGKEARNPLDIFADLNDLLRLIGQDISALERDVKNAVGLAILEQNGADPTATERLRKTSDPWLWQVDATATNHGPSLAAFALGLGVATFREQQSPAWADKTTDDDTLGLDNDQGDTITVAQTDAGIPDYATDDSDTPGDAEKVRLGQIRWCRQNSQRCPRLPPTTQLLVLRIVLGFATRVVWRETDTEPSRIIAKILDSLMVTFDRPTPQPSQLLGSVASLSAVALTVLHQNTDPSVHDERMSIYRHAQSRVEAALAYVDQDKVDEYCKSMNNGNGFPLRAEQVTRTISATVEHDEISGAITAAEIDGHDVTRTNKNLVHISGGFRTAQMPALQFIAAAQDSALVGAWATNSRGAWALAMWRKPNLILVRSTAHQPLWQHYVLNDRVTPRAFLQLRAEGSAGFRRTHQERGGTFSEAQELLKALGIPSPPSPP